MRICVVGAGAIGGLLAAKLAEAGEEVTVIARGAHLAAIRERGLYRRLRTIAGGEEPEVTVDGRRAVVREVPLGA
jgi:ketopantoate reductase